MSGNGTLNRIYRCTNIKIPDTSARFYGRVFLSTGSLYKLLVILWLKGA